MIDDLAPTPAAPVTPAVVTPAAPSATPPSAKPAAPSAKAAKPAASPLPKPGTEVGMTAGGAVIKASGVNPDAPKEDIDFGAAGRAYLERAKAKPEAERTVGEQITAAVADAQATPAAAAVEEHEDDGSHGDLSWNERVGRWQGADGKFVKAEPPTVDELGAAGLSELPAPVAGATADAPAAIKVTLPGLAENGEEDVEIETEDPVVAERVQRLRKEGMRRQAYNEAMQEVQSSRAELAALEEHLATDPVGFAIERMQPERQLEVARALLLEHFDSLTDDINKYLDDPSNRQEERVALRDRMRTSNAELREKQARTQYAASVMRAAETTFLPDDVDPATAERFLADAESDLIRAARAGHRVTPESVPQLLADRAALYGFEVRPLGTERPASNGAARPAAPAATRPAPSNGAARPMTDRARTIAERKTVASEAQHRIRRLQTLRKSAAAIAPPGVGAATVQAPTIPADADIATASSILRRTGKLRSDGYGPVRP